MNQCNSGLSPKDEKRILTILRFGVPTIIVIMGCIYWAFAGMPGLVIPALALAVWFIPCGVDPAIQLREKKEREAGRWK